MAIVGWVVAQCTYQVLMFCVLLLQWTYGKLARETHVIEYGLVQSPEAETLVGLVGFTLLHR